jgi:hypothetical protein
MIPDDCVDGDGNIRQAVRLAGVEHGACVEHAMQGSDQHFEIIKSQNCTAFPRKKLHQLRYQSCPYKEMLSLLSP